jgi:hypothetical protein
MPTVPTEVHPAHKSAAASKIRKPFIVPLLSSVD